MIDDLDYGYFDDEWEEAMGRRTVVGFGSGHRSGRSGGWSYGYPASLHTVPDKDVEIPVSLFMNNYFLVKFTCGSCGKEYNTFSARPDVEVTCIFCKGDGHLDVTEVFEEFELKEHHIVCANCKLAADTHGLKPVSCPKCGGDFNAELEKGQETEETE